MKLQNFSEQVIKEKLTRLYKKSPFYRPKYKGPKVDTDITKKKSNGNIKLIPTEKKRPMMDYETMESVNREKKPILTYKKKGKKNLSFKRYLS